MLDFSSIESMFTDGERPYLTINDLARRGEGLAETVSDFLMLSEPDYVYWLEKSGRHRQITTLCSAPVEVSSILAARLYPAFQSVILTSATLSVAGSLEYARRRLGELQAVLAV